jgi:hypothetical protein
VGLDLRSWGAVLVLLLASAAVYGYRIHVEEEALVEKFGEEYRVYERETKMLVPGVVGVPGRPPARNFFSAGDPPDCWRELGMSRIYCVGYVMLPRSKVQGKTFCFCNIFRNYYRL